MKNPQKLPILSPVEGPHELINALHRLIEEKQAGEVIFSLGLVLGEVIALAPAGQHQADLMLAGLHAIRMGMGEEQTAPTSQAVH